MWLKSDLYNLRDSETERHWDKWETVIFLIHRSVPFLFIFNNEIQGIKSIRFRIKVAMLCFQSHLDFIYVVACMLMMALCPSGLLRYIEAAQKRGFQRKKWRKYTEVNSLSSSLKSISQKQNSDLWNLFKKEPDLNGSRQ